MLSNNLLGGQNNFPTERTNGRWKVKTMERKIEKLRNGEKDRK